MGRRGRFPLRPPLPSGAKSLKDFGERIMRWGTHDDEARAVIGQVSRDDLLREGMTPALAEQWRDWYDEVKNLNPANPSAAGRVDLMDWVMRLLKP